MYRIKTLNKISPAGLSVLDQTRYTISTDVENEDGILVRSADMHDYAFPDALRAVARAGAGTNNIPIDRCSEAGIVVFNTPGANANAVKELAVCALLLASRKISDGVAWVKEQAAAGADVEQAVEKGKSQFVGPELSGKMLGVIGLGAIGVLVAIAAIIQVSRIGSMDYASAGSGYEMDAIAAVIVGGTSMSGGKGSIVGTVLGMLIIGVMNNLLTLFGVPPFLREACKGVIVIVAVLLQKKEADA